MKPVTRLETLVQAIIEGSDLPFSAVDRIEMFLSDIISGQVSQITPITRIETYLAKISGADVQIPTPVTRTEYFLASIAGQDINLPTPITRLEMLLNVWADSAASHTLSGSIVSFLGKSNTEILSLTAAITPVQDLHGYDYPWAGGAGKNKMPTLTAAIEVNGVTATPTSDGGIALSGKPTVTSYIDLDTSFDSTSYAGYLFSGLPDTGTWNTSSVSYRITAADSRTSIQDFTRTNGTYNSQVVRDNGSGLRFAIRIPANYQLPDDFVIYPMLRAADTSDTFEPYANICPITGFTGANIYVSPTQNQGDATTYTFDWTSAAGTVYAGSHEAVSGKLKARPQYASYNGETLVGPWLSSVDAYAAGATPTTGAQVVDLGGTETEYTLTPQQVAALVGQNYVWADSGDVSVTVKNIVPQ